MDGLERRFGPAAHHKLLMELRELRGTRTLCLHVNITHVVLQSNTSPVEEGIACLLSWRRWVPGKSPACPWLPGGCSTPACAAGPAWSQRLAEHPAQAPGCASTQTPALLQQHLPVYSSGKHQQSQPLQEPCLHFR